MIAFPCRHLLTGLACLAALTATPLPAGETKTAKVDPKARELLDQVDKAYKALGAYSDHGEFKVAMTVNGLAQHQSMPLRLALVRPNKVNLDAEEVRLVSNGKTMTTVVVPIKRYAEMPAPQAITPDTLKEGPVGAMLFGGLPGVPMRILLNLLVGGGPDKLIADIGGNLKADEDCTVDGVSCPALLFDQEEGPDYRLVVDPKSKLLKKIDFVFDPKDMAAGLPQGQKISIQTFGWNPGAVSTKEEGELFAYQPAQGLTKVESPEEIVKRESPVDALVGKPAPDFTLTVLDGEDKTKTLSKADLAGKVVMIDFWATWCGPCMMELPEVQKLVEAYAKDKKDLVVVALSEDKGEDKGEGGLTQVRKLVETTLSEKKIELTGNPIGKVALDPSGTIGEAFQVTGLPTVVLLDAQGVVQAAHVGYSPQVRETLTKDLDALLAGKSLAKPKGQKAVSDKK